MVTRNDLLEANAFNRRRLLAAFVSGAPGGSEAEPSRPGRAMVAGLVLAILVLAAAVVASVLAPR